MIERVCDFYNSEVGEAAVKVSEKPNIGFARVNFFAEKNYPTAERLK